MHATRFAGLIFVLCSAAHSGCAQEIALPRAEGPVAINGPWLITTDDGGQHTPGTTHSPGWRPFTWYPPPGNPTQPAVLWLRATLHISDPPPSPALLISPSAEGCQIFLDGVEAASCTGSSVPNGKTRRGILVHIPPALTGRPLSIAVRLYHPGYVASGKLIVAAGSTFESGSDTRNLGLGSGGVVFGSLTSLVDQRTARDARHFYDYLPQALLCVAELLGGALLLAVFVFDRRREYAWFLAFLWLDGTCSILSVLADVYPVQNLMGLLASDMIGQITRYVPLIGFLGAFTGVRIPRWIRAYQWCLVALPFVIVLTFKAIQLGFSANLSSWFDYLLLGAQFPFVAGSLLFLGVQWRRGNKEAALLLPSFLLANGFEVVGFTVPSFYDRLHIGRFGFNCDDLSMFFFLVSIGPVMLLRQRRISLDHARATAELDAAREIQQRLVPATLPSVPGFELSAQYRPAAEVGGDFYQIFYRREGSILIVVGDVSGKGLQAAMKGTMLLGALGALATDELKPADLLRHLNNETARSNEGGFITCLAACIHADGTATIANAGHLSPYQNNKEVELECGLPLGLAAGITYPETAFKLEPGDRLTFMSDGVIEARNSSGELFGFERTAAISDQSASQIAAAAQAFGQEDDITVLCMTFAGTPGSGVPI